MNQTISNLTRRQVYLLASSLLVTSIIVLVYLPALLKELDGPQLYRVQEQSNLAAHVCTAAASYVSPSDLLNGQIQDTGYTEKGVPKLIHQSWMDRDLPIKFKQWSDTFRLKHPDWKWILWTDNDNAELVARHPELEPVYRALRNGIQRADFIRNLYMWEFGGIYADLDMECLRSFDYLLDDPSSYLSPRFPMFSAISSTSRLAYLGAMETHEGEWFEHGLPNAFMASIPRHPLWLFPISRVLRAFRIENNGDRPVHDPSTDGTGAEDMTGPVALLRSLATYKSYKQSGGDLRAELAPILAPMMADMTEDSAQASDVAVLDDGVIYPFSWVAQVAGVGNNWHCMAAHGTNFNPRKCFSTFDSS